MTFALTNVWSHGTWVTPSHAHLALFGTFGMLGIAAAYYAVPILRKVTNYDQRLGKLSFWLTFTGMLGMSFAFAIGGTIQIFVYRTLGLEWFGGDVFPAMGFFKLLVPFFGLVFTIGAGLLVFDLLTLGARLRVAAPSRGATAGVRYYDLHGVSYGLAGPATGWSRYLTGYETGIWLLGMWVFGAIITFGLLSFNLPRVQAGDATLPYLLAGVGYPGLLVVTLLFVWRFLSSLEARALEPAPAPEVSQEAIMPAPIGA
jgi:nitric oxide reductase subunit B